MTTRIAMAALTVLLAARSAHADECPQQVPDDTTQRRELAKTWFSRGQSATQQGNDIAALKAYQCSMKFVPHGFTAYNIAQIAERIGDLELAIANYSQYLLLIPDAKDSQQVQQRIDALKQRLTRVEQREKQEAVLANADTGGGPSPEAGQPSAKPLPSTAAPAPRPRARPAEALAAQRPHRPPYRTAGWITLAGSGVVLAVGLVANVLARGQMDTARSKWATGDQAGAQSAHSEAETLAYTSYAAFGVGAIGAVVGAVLTFYPDRSEQLAVRPLPDGGLALGWSGRF